MFRIMNEYMRGIKLQVLPEIEAKIDKYLDSCDDLEKYCITVQFNRYILDIKLKDYSVDASKEHFENLCKNIKYDYSDISVRYNEGKVVRYRYASCKENKDGFYCDIIYS